jgi:hypothetical protein
MASWNVGGNVGGKLMNVVNVKNVRNECENVVNVVNECENVGKVGMQFLIMNNPQKWWAILTVSRILLTPSFYQPKGFCSDGRRDHSDLFKLNQHKCFCGDGQ